MDTVYLVWCQEMTEDKYLCKVFNTLEGARNYIAQSEKYDPESNYFSESWEVE